MSNDTNQAAPAAPESAEEAESTETEGTEASAEQQAAPTIPEAKAEQKYLNKLKLKFDKGEVEEELPFEIPDDPKIIEYMTKHLQMSRLGHTRAQQYTTLEKQVTDFVEQLKKNPKKALQDPNVNVDLKKLAQEILEEEIENSKKSPEQIEKEKLQARLKELEDERKTEQDNYKTKEFERLQQQEFERYDMLMSKALETSDLPRSPYVVKKMADYMLMGLQEGLDVTPSDVIPLVREEIANDLKDMFAVMPTEVIESIIGKDVLNKIRKNRVNSAKKAPASPKATLEDVGKSPEKKEDKQSKQTFKQFFGA